MANRQRTNRSTQVKANRGWEPIAANTNAGAPIQMRQGFSSMVRNRNFMCSSDQYQTHFQPQSGGHIKSRVKNANCDYSDSYCDCDTIYEY